MRASAHLPETVSTGDERLVLLSATGLAYDAPQNTLRSRTIAANKVEHSISLPIQSQRDPGGVSQRTHPSHCLATTNVAGQHVAVKQFHTKRDVCLRNIVLSCTANFLLVVKICFFYTNRDTSFSLLDVSASGILSPFMAKHRPSRAYATLLLSQPLWRFGAW